MRLVQALTIGETTLRGWRGGPQGTGLFPQAERVSPSRKDGHRVAKNFSSHVLTESP